jgi:uncharacterized membrane protein (GlpM family)
MSTTSTPLFGADMSELRKVKFASLAMRFGFGAAISVIAGLAGITLGTVVGGMLLAFPAILPAALTLIEKEDGNADAVHDVGGAILGGFGLIAFAIAGALLFAKIPIAAVVLCCLAAWTVTSLVLYVLRSKEHLPLPRSINGRAPREVVSTNR